MPSSHVSSASREPIGVQVQRHTTLPGRIELYADPDHRVKVHAGAPVRGWCDAQAFLYTRGDVDIIPAGLSSAWDEHDANTSLFLKLPPALLRRAAVEIGLDPDRVGLEPRHQLRDVQIEHVAWALDAESLAGHPNGLLYTESLGLALAVHLLGRYRRSIASPRGLSRPQLRRVTEYIEEHLDRDLSLARLGEVAGLSASHLKTQFRLAAGMPVHRYVVRRRVERAKRLLQSGDLPPAHVALAVGFAHQSHMARWMRRILGITPGALARGARG